MYAASSSAIGTFPLMNPWNMNTDIAMENPVCMKIKVILWFRTFSVPPYMLTRGIMIAWNGMIMDATIKANVSLEIPLL